MVQVDIVWSYAFGASIAAASGPMLAAETKAFDNKFYVRVLVFLACFFAPSGMLLLWNFPSWETMQVAKSAADLPGWLVTLFCVTNVTQGILGYYVTYRLARADKTFGVHLNWMIPWVVFWFILVAGWDTLGWQRFLYDGALNNGMPWAPGMHMGIEFVTGPVCLSLVGMGVLFAPMLHFVIVKPNAEHQARKRNLAQPTHAMYRKVAAVVGFCAVTCALTLAIVAAQIVRLAVAFTGNMVIGYVVGLAIAIAVEYALVFRPGGPAHRIAKWLW